MLRLSKIVLTLGLGIIIGTVVPLLTWYKPFIPDGFFPAAENITTNVAEGCYHFTLQDGNLAVAQGKVGESGPIIIKGLDIAAWPNSLIEMALKTEFYSLDEVQSFIDSIYESM